MLQQAVMTGEELKQALAELPRVPFAVVHTPLEECPRLTEALGGPRIFIKRDDLTGLAHDEGSGQLPVGCVHRARIRGQGLVSSPIGGCPKPKH